MSNRLNPHLLKPSNASYMTIRIANQELVQRTVDEQSLTKRGELSPIYSLALGTDNKPLTCGGLLVVTDSLDRNHLYAQTLGAAFRLTNLENTTPENNQNIENLQAAQAFAAEQMSEKAEGVFSILLAPAAKEELMKIENAENTTRYFKAKNKGDIENKMHLNFYHLFKVHETKFRNRHIFSVNDDNEYTNKMNEGGDLPLQALHNDDPRGAILMPVIGWSTFYIPARIQVGEYGISHPNFAEDAYSSPEYKDQRDIQKMFFKKDETIRLTSPDSITYMAMKTLHQGPYINGKEITGNRRIITLVS